MMHNRLSLFLLPEVCYSNLVTSHSTETLISIEITTVDVLDN